MTNTFLREVHIEDFRTFGEFTLPVPPGPGLTLLVGTNGLGKSSFFDGIEWCLTGTIRRFQDYVGRLKESDYLTRRDAETGTHKVRLTFARGEQLVRTLSEHPSAAALLDLLKDPKWAEITDVGAYLGFTHFLGQASQQRFTSRNQSEQWQALKGPSGIDRLELVRSALRGRATTFAFRRRMERESAAVSVAMRDLDEWIGSVSRLADLQARSAAVGAESEAALSARLSAIELELPARDRMSEDFMERLAIARSAIEAEQRQLATKLGGLVGLQTLVGRFGEACARIERNNARLAIAATGIGTATTQLGEAMLAASRAEQMAAAQAEAVARSEADYAECLRVRSLIAEFDLLNVEWQTLHTSEAVLKAERGKCEVDLDSAQNALSSAYEAQGTLRRLDAHQATLQIWYSRAVALKVQEEAAQKRRAAAIAASAVADRERLQLGELERILETARDAEATAEASLVARQRDASQLAELLSGLAAHIQHDDLSCPVCASDFPKGELQSRARTVLASQDAQLASDVRALDILRDRSKAAAQARALAQSVIDVAVAAITTADGAEAAATSERLAIAEEFGVDVDSDLMSMLTERLTEVDRARIAHMREAGGSDSDVSSAQMRVDTLSAAMASLDERLATAAQRRVRIETALHAIDGGLSGHPKPWSIGAAERTINARRILLDEGRVALEDLALKRAAAANAEVAARERLGAAEAERDRIAAAIRNAEAARTATIDGWQQARMTGEPAGDAADAWEAALREQASSLAGLFEEANALSRSYEAFLAQNELRSLRKVMIEKGGQGAADNPVPRAQELQKQLKEARLALQLTTATRDAVLAYGDQLKAEAESFSNQFLLPLNNLIDGFNQALLSTPGETVQFNAEHTVERTALAMQLRYGDAIDNAQYKTTLPPQLVLSEGQMAANGFSILCAASTAYRWSRWRALLLDDPLQHNDIIHAAAFVDVMRNLVEFEGYQLIMSSHKRDEGEFIARKFDAAGLPCTVVELLGASKDGVRVAQPRHNAAARRLLAEPEARLA
ncbi:AAA family ATPase [Variovorax sp. J22P271]|uniref:AAA family ATPase n=1 Tax=Variovorax davisae TaxID=3053515 RepID=UPI0025777388|nr:AAA family ATPase [Variovorax sp. J22P271]MDM0037043.1 AAA family ATPase [Variovorax sp. J22P271]